MFISELVSRINHKLANDVRSTTEIVGYMDMVIDDINTALNSRFPTYTEEVRAIVFPESVHPDFCPKCHKPFLLPGPQIGPQNYLHNPFATHHYLVKTPVDHCDCATRPAETIPDTPAVSDNGRWLAGAGNICYKHIPDKYQRSVVIPGAAVKIYESDEEGNQSAIMFKQEYQLAIYHMQRDFSFSIPLQYREYDQGLVNLSDHDIETPGLRVSNNPFGNDRGFR